MIDDTPATPGLVVVLGMHRSGTSAVTRALGALGVALGERLLPPLEGVNDKGFFEDVDVLQVNIDVLKALAMDWHSVGEIDLGKLDPARLDGLQMHAVSLLRAKCVGAPFALKDPRMARLLPFWKPVFECVGVPVAYVVVARNPISVVQSLARRNGFGEERSYLLWLAHLVPALADTRGCVRTVVDYDLLLDDPPAHLARIGAALGLPVDAAQAARLGDTFLSDTLRHSRFGVRDLNPIRSAPHSVKALYRALADAACGEGSEAALDAAVAAGQQYLRDLAPLLRYDARVHRFLESQQASVEQRDQQIAQLKATLAERDKQLAELQRTLADMEAMRASTAR